MLLDELRWINPAAGILTITRPDEWRDELTHLKMEMGQVAAVRGANRRNLLTAPDFVARLH